MSYCCEFFSFVWLQNRLGCNSVAVLVVVLKPQTRQGYIVSMSLLNLSHILMANPSASVGVLSPSLVLSLCLRSLHKLQISSFLTTQLFLIN